MADVANAQQVRPRAPRYRVILVALFAIVVAIVAGLEWHKRAINGTVQTALAGETGAETSVYRRNLLGGNEIVFDVKSTTGEISMVDMTRRLLKAASIPRVRL